MLIISFLNVQYIGTLETSICLMSCKTHSTHELLYGKETATDLKMKLFS